MNTVLKGLLFITLLLSSTLASSASCVQTNNSIGLIGLDGRNIIYSGVSDHSNQCGCTNFRFKEIYTDHKVALSVLMSAKMSNKKVRIDILDETDCNSAYRVYVQ